MKFYLNEPIYISSLCNNKYRQRAESCVQWVRREGSYGIVRQYFLNWMQLYMQQHDIHYKNVKRLFRKAMDQYNHPVIYNMKKVIKNLLAIQNK